MTEVNLGNLVVLITSDMTSLNAGLKQAEKNVKDTTGKIAEYTNKIGIAMTAIGGAIVGAYGLMIKASVNYADQLYEVSERTGVAVETLSAFKYVADQTESSFEAVANGLKYLNKNIYEATNGNVEMNKNFRALGVELEDTNGRVLKADEVFLKLADRFSLMTDSSAKTNLAMAIFGRQGEALIPVLSLGSEKIKELSETAKKLGLVLTADSAKSIDQFSDNMKSLKASLGGLWLEISQLVIPMIDKFVAKLTEIIIKTREWIEAHPKLSGAIGEFSIKLGAVLFVLGPTVLLINNMAKALRDWYVVLSVLLPAMKIFTTFRMAGLLTDIAILSANVGVLYPTILLIGTALASWKLGRFIGEVTNLDNALSGKDGLFTKMWEWLLKIEEKAGKIWGIIDAISRIAELGRSGGSKEKGGTPSGGPAPTVAPGLPGPGGEAPAMPDIEDAIKKHAAALRQLNEEYVQGNIDSQEYYRSVLELHNQGMDIKQVELDTLEQSMELQNLATDQEYQKLLVTQQGIQTAQEYYRVRAMGANQEEADNIKTLASATNLLRTIQSMKASWGDFFSFLNMGIQTFSKSFSTAISSIILGTKTAGQAFKDFGIQMVEAIVNFVVQWAVQVVIAMVLGKLIENMVASIANNMASMWMTPAILASIASYGAAAVIGTAAVAGAIGLGQSLLVGTKALQPAPIVPHAEGGIFTHPHIGLVAENGPEAIIPLNGRNGIGNTFNFDFSNSTFLNDDLPEGIKHNIAEYIDRVLDRGTFRV